MTNPKRRDDPETDRSEDQEQSLPSAMEPSWFFEGENQPTRAELIARYRKHFSLPEDGVPLAPRRPAPGSAIGYRDLIATPRGLARSHSLNSFRDEPRSGPEHYEIAKPKGPSLRKTYLLAALGAMLAGGSVGFLASQAHSIKLRFAAVIDDLMPAVAVMPEVAIARPVASGAVTKKPIATASLQVEDAAGSVNSLIPLALRAEPAAANQDLLLRIAGLPDKAYLTSGHRQADKVWSLTLADLKDVKLMVPGPSQPEISVDVTAVERSSGELAAPATSMTIALSGTTIVPVSSPPPQSPMTREVTTRTDMPAPIPVPMNMGVTLASLQSGARDLIAQGDTSLKAGDVVAARQFYERAWSSGSAEAAMSLARTFDPLAQAQLHLAGTAPDRTRALQWYERAARAGQQEASAAIVRLKDKP